MLAGADEVETGFSGGADLLGAFLDFLRHRFTGQVLIGDKKA